MLRDLRSRSTSGPAGDQAMSALGWIAAAGMTTALHVGAYVTFTREAAPPTATHPVAAVMMVDFEPISVAPRSAVDNASDGPAQDAVEPVQTAEAAAPPPPPPAPPEEQVPVLPPTPPDAKSDAVLPEHVKQVEPPKQEPPEEKAKTEPPREQPPPDETSKTVLPKQDVAPKVMTKNGGGPKSNSQEAKAAANNPTWLANVRTRIVRAKRYPAEANNRGQVGAALVALTISPQGTVKGAALLVSSNVKSLDAEAVAVCSRAAPYPPPPDGETVTLRIPITFNRR